MFENREGLVRNQLQGPFQHLPAITKKRQQKLSEGNLFSV